MRQLLHSTTSVEGQIVNCVVLLSVFTFTWLLSQESKSDMNTRTLSIILLLLTVCAVAQVARAADVERIVITNARLVGRDAAALDVSINILIEDGRLVVVTKDELVIEPDDISVDSNGGFLKGRKT